MIRPSCAITAPKGPPRPARTLLTDSSIARRISELRTTTMLPLSAGNQVSMV